MPDAPGDPELSVDGLEDVEQTLRAVARADQRDAEHVALREAWRRRSYADVLQESMWRGDRVGLHLQGCPTLRGQLIDTGRDFVTLAPDAAGTVPIDVQIAAGLAALEIIERGAFRGTRGTGDAFVKFAARLNEYAYLTEAMPTRRVVVAHRAAESGCALVRGELRAFAWDHIYLGIERGEGERQRAGGRGPSGEGERQRAGGRGPSGDVFVPLSMLAYIHWIERYRMPEGLD